MTHQEAIDKLLSMYPTQAALAKSLGTTQQNVSNFKRNGVLPRRYWPLVSAEPSINITEKPKDSSVIDINELTLSQARALYEQLKEVFK